MKPTAKSVEALIRQRNEIDYAIRTNLRAIICDSSLTYRQMAAASGIAASTIHDFVKGRPGTPQLHERIAKLFRTIEEN